MITTIDRLTVLPATSLVETLVALILLSVSFGIGLLIYSNVIQNRLPYTQSKASTVLHQAFIDMERQEAWNDKVYDLGGFTIEQTVEPTINTKGVFTVTLTAIDPKGNRLHTLQKLIIK